MTATANGLPLLECTLTMPGSGVWHADLTVDSSEPLDGSVTLDIEGQTFSGTVLPGRSGVYGGRATAKIAGGNASMPTKLGAKQYVSGVGAGVTIDVIVRDILREAGETLSATSDAAVLAVSLPKWERLETQASRALVGVLAKQGATWRVLDDGTVWVGVPSYPAVDLGEYVLTDEDWAQGVYEIAPLAPLMRPGVTFLGSQINYVVHYLTRGKLRTEAHIAGSPGNSFDRIFSGIKRDIGLSRAYSARVVKQNADKTLELVPDDPVVAANGRSLDKVPIRCGIPAEVETSGGTRCLIMFANGDPARPFVYSFESTVVDKVRINGGSLPAARQGDITTTPFPATTLALLASNLLCGTPGSAPTLNPAAAALAIAQQNIQGADLYGSVTSGNPTIEE